MRKRTWKLALGATAVAATLVTAPMVAADTRAPAANDNPNFVQVYNDNVENLPTVDLRCHGDWKDLVYYMELRPTKPDIYTIHQISGREQLDELIAMMERRLDADYAGRLADPTPKRMDSPCGPPKDYQTNAVIYRTERFEVVKSDHDNWQAQRVDSEGRCVNNTQARTLALKVKLRDKVADENLTVASVHWPTHTAGGRPCDLSNARETAAELTEDGYGGALRIVGGDFNRNELTSGGRYRDWYSALNGDIGGNLGMRDVIFDACRGAADTKACLDDNWTGGRGPQRIDFTFADKPGGLPKVTAAHTITFNEGDRADREVTGNDLADRDYSRHRAVRAHVYY